MTESQSLLAHLTPWFYQPIEDRGTDALAYILNRSAACRAAFDALLSYGNFCPAPLDELKTQVQFDGGKSRIDMVGYDEDRTVATVVESKFWAPLQPRQAWRYYTQLKQAGSGVLLFICPRSQLGYLWKEICAQLEHDEEGPLTLESVPTSDETRRARVVDSENQVLLMSWRHLLDRLDEATQEFEVRADIHQLRGLVRRMNDEAFPPLTPEMSAADFRARDSHFRKMVRDAVAQGRREGWLRTKNLTWGRTRSYHRRYFSVVNASPVWLGIGVEYQEDLYKRTPIWVSVPVRFWPDDAKHEGLAKGRDYWKLPIRLKADAVGDDVLNDVVAQLKRITDLFVPAQ